MAEEGLDYIQDFVTWPVRKIYDFKYYINNRYVTRTHSLTAHPRDIKPGNWCDVGNRFLPCLFNELVDFVEVELAWVTVAWSPEAREKYNSPFYAWGWFRWRTWRCPEAGIEHLKWAMTLNNSEWLNEDEKHLAEPTGQALSAAWILSAYNWWKFERPARPDPMDASGWSEFCENRRATLKTRYPETNVGFVGFGDNDNEEEKSESRRILDLCHTIEKSYEEEDTKWLKELIDYRGHLWT